MPQTRLATDRGKRREIHARNRYNHCVPCGAKAKEARNTSNWAGRPRSPSPRCPGRADLDRCSSGEPQQRGGAVTGQASEGHPQLEDGTVYRQLRPTQLDKIKNLHSTDTIDTENSGTRGGPIWVHSSQVGKADSKWVCHVVPAYPNVSPGPMNGSILLRYPGHYSSFCCPISIGSDMFQSLDLAVLIHDSGSSTSSGTTTSQTSERRPSRYGTSELSRFQVAIAKAVADVQRMLSGT